MRGSAPSPYSYRLPFIQFVAQYRLFTCVATWPRGHVATSTAKERGARKPADPPETQRLVRRGGALADRPAVGSSAPKVSSELFDFSFALLDEGADLLNLHLHLCDRVLQLLNLWE